MDRSGGEASPTPSVPPGSGSPTKSKPGMLRTKSTATGEHPLSPAGTPRVSLPRRVSAAEAGLGISGVGSGYFDVQPRRHAASVSTTTPLGPNPPSPAVMALTTAAHASGVLLTPGRRAPSYDADLLGLSGVAGPSRPRRSSEKAERALFGDEDDHTPRRPAANRRGPLPSGGWGWAGYLNCLSRDEVDVLDTPYDTMSDTDLEAALRPFAETEDGKRKSSTRNGVSTTPTATPLFPPSPPGTAAPRAEHPLRVLSRVVRELREVISQLEDENARLRATDSATGSPAPSRSQRRASGGSALGSSVNSGPKPAMQSNDASPRPVPLPAVAERTGDQLHDSLADALSTSLTSPTHSHLSLMEPRKDYERDGDGFERSSRSPTPSYHSGARARSPALSTRSTRSWSERARATSGASIHSASGVQLDKDGKDKRGWGIWTWSKKPGRKGSVGSLTPSMASGMTPEDEEWRKGDGGSVPSFRAIFLATRILTPDPASILIEPARANPVLAGLAHALVSKARDEDIAVREPPGRARSRSRAASVSSVRQVASPTSAGEGDPSAPGYGYGDQALAATVAVGRTLLSLSRGKAAPGETWKNRPGIPPPVRLPRTTYPTSQASPHTPVTPTTALDTPPPSVELGTIVPDESRPPTVLLSRQNLGSFFQSSRSTKMTTATRFTSENDEPPLTDRYGFIYDIQHASMLKDASRAGTPAPISLTGHIPELHHTGSDDHLAVPDATSRPASLLSLESRNGDGRQERESSSLTVTSPDSRPQSGGRTPETASPPNGSSASRKRPSALAPAPPKATAAKDELTISVRGTANIQSGPSSSLGGGLGSSSSTPTPPASTKASRGTVSSLLDQLTEIHDRQQKARTSEWDAFLRRRAKRRVAGRDQDVGMSGAIAGVVALAGTQSKSGQEDYRLFQRLVRRGIPMPYRADIWAECSGARDLLVPGEYAEILAVHRDDHSPVMAEIEKDVGRTFPGNVFFGGDGPGVAKLRRLLVAYSWHNPAVGYCQGMNMLAATLLLTHTDEEQAFWVLHCMIERLLPPDFYAPSLLGSRADQVALADLVAQHVPRVFAHLSALGVDLTSVTFGWFLSLFTDCLPVETLFRVWDVFFVEGHPVLFRVAVAILKLNESELCATESVTELFTFISSMTARLWGADKLIALQHSYKSALKDKEVQTLVERQVAALQREIDGESE